MYVKKSNDPYFKTEGVELKSGFKKNIAYFQQNLIHPPWKQKSYFLSKKLDYKQNYIGKLLSFRKLNLESLRPVHFFESHCPKSWNSNIFIGITNATQRCGES